MRFAVENYQFFWIWSLFIIFANLRKSQCLAIRIVASDNKQFAAFQLVSRDISIFGQHDYAINFSRRSFGRSISCSSATQARADDRHGLCSRLSQISHGGQHIEVKRGGINVSLSRSLRLSVPAKVKGQHTEAIFNQHLRLVVPTLFIELSSMGQ